MTKTRDLHHEKRMQDLKYQAEYERQNLEADEAWIEYQRTGESVSNEAMTGWLEAWGTDQEAKALRRLNSRRRRPE